ncbi:NAD-dependent epimerase/dehydratase family protein [Natronomonas salina]|uniref:NAD-dependent epimerase/dehydratase family protein n=1 Tax=Natronomonas salina TaxID=1710540 RepID=UPI0015B506C0|nr:NAD-dependent epimerase/dehydratase family protein [Natronomonas salina]QLD90789.1 NAD-dependent epimerase/dehydratase family protein [Natronomonas salina]
MKDNETLNLLDAALECFVITSSSSVYGGREEYPPVFEDWPDDARLAARRLEARCRVLRLRLTRGVRHPAVALQYFIVYGLWVHPIMAILNFVSRCLNGQSLVVYGDGTQTRDSHPLTTF